MDNKKQLNEEDLKNVDGGIVVTDRLTGGQHQRIASISRATTSGKIIHNGVATLKAVALNAADIQLCASADDDLTTTVGSCADATTTTIK